MKHSNNFINKIKEIYPNNPEIIRAALKGDYILGRYLDDSSDGSISLNEILIATSLEEIQGKAKRVKQKIDLFNEWFKEQGGRRL